MASIRKWNGWKAGVQITVSQHQKWSVSLEAYIKEGKAPIPELAPLFQRMRQWFLEVYRNLRLQLRKLDPEAKEIFDRLLATEDEIAQASQSYVGALSSILQSIMTPAQVENYRGHAEKAGQTARDKLFAKHIEDINRRNRKWWKEQRALVEKDVTAEMEKRGDVRAFREFIEGEARLDTAEVEALKPGASAKIPTAEGGILPDDIAA